MQASPYYGTYHHTTPEQSESTRSELKSKFENAFEKIKGKVTVNNIMDAGCGLGFLCAVSAKYFPAASVLGIDLFGSESLPEGSITLARQNMEMEHIAERVRFLESDLKTLDLKDVEFELIISNLVFHNLGKSRFQAYKNVIKFLKPQGALILGDFFMDSRDKKFLSDLLNFEGEITEIHYMPMNYSIVIFKK
ncbi:MAG: class I SAM-dependent methyltransferase [Thermoplasmataceae archaeon]|jgi:ubiquinone/menaquinone biosynthesis C-methylase UbiE